MCYSKLHLRDCKIENVLYRDYLFDYRIKVTIRNPY